MFQPAIPLTGLAGWRFLQGTYDRQFEAFTNNASIKRDTEYFDQNIGSVQSAEDLVSNRRLLSVALGAFGLTDDLNNTFFIRKMLEEGTTNPDAFANRFADNRYKDFSKAFGLGPGEIKLTGISLFMKDISAKYERQSFETAVGAQDDTLRVALAAERSLETLERAAATERGRWFTVMGLPPLRALFETAFNLPTSFSQIDIDKQQEILADRSERIFGVSDPADFAEDALKDALIVRYTALSSIRAFSASSSSSSIALSLLRS